MVYSMKVALLLSVVVVFTLASSLEDTERVNLDHGPHGTIVMLLNETIQHWQEKGTAEMKELLRQLSQERQQEMHQKCEEEGRENQLHSAIDNMLSLQGLVIEILRDMRETRQHQQTAALNTSLEIFIQQYQTNFRALKASITKQACQVEAEFHLNDDCTITQCTEGYLQPYQGVRAANVSFSDLVAKKCVHLERSNMTWNDARTNCVSMGGDLFVAGDMLGALNYLQETIPNGWAWVGLRDELWIDGRSVTLQEWFPGESNAGSDACGHFGFWKSRGPGLWDDKCVVTSFSLCQKRVTFQ